MKEETRKMIQEKLASEMERILSEDLTEDNINSLYKLVDIDKDLVNEEYWEIKKEVYKNEIRKLWRRLWKKNER